MVAGLKSQGAALSANDLIVHETEITAPLELRYEDFVLETSPPNSQGFVLLQTVAALDAMNVKPDPLGSGATYFLRSCLLAAEDRDRWLGDPRHVRVPLDELLDRDALRRRLSARMQARPVIGTALPSHGDTVAVCAMDSGGLSVSLIQSLYQTFGCGILEPQSGVIFHNRARGFSLVAGAANELVPGTRPAHTLMPLLVRKEGKVIASMGTMGGRAQAQILSQLLPGVLNADAALQDILKSPRWVCGSKDLGFHRPTVAVERDAPADLDDLLHTDGLELQRIPSRDERTGHAQIVRLRSDGNFEAASDPRSDGAAAMFPA